MKPIYACILAGGQAQRFNRELKGLKPLNGQPLITHILQRLEHQSAGQAINSHHREYAAYIEQAALKVDLISDLTPLYSGPLAGLYSCMTYMTEKTDFERLLLCACDTPFLPLNLSETLSNSLPTEGASCIQHKGRMQPTFSLWHKALLPKIRTSVIEGEMGGFKSLAEELGEQFKLVDYTTDCDAKFDPFFNINTEADLAFANEIAKHVQ